MLEAEAVPRTIHYCWFGGRPMTELGERCLETWRDHMPGYAIERWDESRLDRTIPYVDMAYRERRFAFVADYVRCLALYQHGGLYFDTDIEVIRPFDPLLAHPLFMGLQAPGSVGVGVVGATKGHPFLRRVLDRLDAEAQRGALRYEPLPELVTALAGADGPDQPVLFPEDVFYPYNPYSPVPLRRKPLQSHISDRTYCLHHWEGTWLGEASLKMILSLRLRAIRRKLAPARWRLFSPQPGGMRP